MQQLTDKELKIIAGYRAYKANRTLKKGLICAGALLPFILLDMWLIYAKHITSGWAWLIFAGIMLTLWTVNYQVRKKEMRLSTDILKDLRQEYGL
jgi:hypothetical protein